MSKLAFGAMVLAAIGCQPLHAQTPPVATQVPAADEVDLRCDRCSAAQLAALRGVLRNTDAMRADAAAMRTQIEALTRSVATLTAAINGQRPYHVPFFVEYTQSQPTAAGADGFCSSIPGYNRGRVVNPSHASVVCYWVP